MKLYRNAIILLVVLGLLIGAYVIVKNKKADSDAAQSAATTETAAPKIIDIGLEKAKEITIEGKDGKLVLEKKDKDWILTQPVDVKTDKTMVEGLASDIVNLNSQKVIEEKAQDLGKYGLSSPSVIVTVKSTDGKTEAFELGNATPLKDGYYVKIKDTDKVYTMSSPTGDKLLSPKNSIRSKVLFEGSADDVTGFGLQKDGKVVFSAKKSGTGDKAEWKLTAPIEEAADAANLGSMVETAVKASIAEFVEENPSDLSKYGLDKPSYIIELETTKGGKNKILLGKTNNETGNSYAKLDGSSLVFSIDASAFNFLDKPLKEIVNVFAYIQSIWDVKQIVVDMDGQTTTCDIQANQDKNDEDKFKVNGKDANMKDANDKQPFRNYYQALIGITLSDIEIGAVPQGKPEITFTYYLKNGNTMRIDFVSKDDKNYYVLRNDRYCNFVVSKKKFDEPEGVRESYKKLMEALNKK